jgi:hypothetical protein
LKTHSCIISAGSIAIERLRAATVFARPVVLLKRA